MQRAIQLQNVNSYLLCGLCKGYLIDATTTVECLHSFCRSCIVSYVATSFSCPVCGIEIHKTKPLENVRSDPALQEIVYKLVPDLYVKERAAKSAFEDSSADRSTDKLPEDDDSRALVTLKYFRGTSRFEKIKTERVLQMFPTRYLCCPQEMPVKVLRKFILHKFDLNPEFWKLDLWRGDETLFDHLTVRQLIRIYGCYRERKPLELHFSLLPNFPPEASVFKDPEVIQENNRKTPTVLQEHAKSEIYSDNPSVSENSSSFDKNGQCNINPIVSEKEESLSMDIPSETADEDAHPEDKIDQEMHEGTADGHDTCADMELETSKSSAVCSTADHVDKNDCTPVVCPSNIPADEKLSNTDKGDVDS